MPRLTLRSDAGVLSFDEGRVLVGGSPLRILRLTDAGAGRVADWFAGGTVPNDSASRRLARRLFDTGVGHPSYADSPASSDQVTVVIPVKDDAEGLSATLAALGSIAAIVVVDDGSKEPVVASSEHTAVAVIRHGVALGPAAARNSGLAHVTTEFVAFLDADVEPQPGWLDAMLPHFCDDRVAAVAPQVRSRPGTGILARYESLNSPLDLGNQPARVAPRSRVSYVPTAALLARAETLRAHPAAPDQCFDPTLRYGEDVDLIWRLVTAKQVIRYEPDAQAVHRPRPSLGAFARQRFGYGSAAAPLAKRHEGAVAPVIVSAWSAAAWAVGSLINPLLGVAIATGSTLSIRPKMEAIPERDRLAIELSAKGNLHAGRQMAAALTRPWWPVALVGSLASRRVRRVTTAAFIVPAMWDWITTRSVRATIDPLRYLGLRVVDDISYGAGVWRGCIDEQTIAPLKPDLTDWRP